MIAWDSAITNVLTAAAKVYAAMKLSYPSGQYGSGTSVTITIDGSNYTCRCDCTGFIQTIIQVMGYNPNWGVSSVSGHVGDGWYLTDATTSFVQDLDGNISSDWVVLPFDANDVRPGDIRASATHSHCDIFVDYKNGNAYGLNAGATSAILESYDAGTEYLATNDEDVLAATWTIQDNDTAKILRYVKGLGDNPSSTGNNYQINDSRSLKALDVELAFVEKLEFEYSLRKDAESYHRVVPGYFPTDVCYPTGMEPADDSLGDRWLEFVANYRAQWAITDIEWKEAVLAGLVMMFTLDNSDPLLYGRTIYLHEDGTNDYETSKGLAPIIRTQFPVHFRCVLTDSATHTIDYGRSSAYFTNESATDLDMTVAQIVKAANYFSFQYDASGAIPESEDAHGYLMLNDESTEYTKEDYIEWLTGREE